jgi:hypothetical protein
MTPKPEPPIRPDEVESLFPMISEFVRYQGWIKIGHQDGQGFVVRALDEGGMVFEDTKSKSLGEALTTLERKIAELDR